MTDDRAVAARPVVAPGIHGAAERAQFDQRAEEDSGRLRASSVTRPSRDRAACRRRISLETPFADMMDGRDARIDVFAPLARAADGLRARATAGEAVEA